MSTKEKKPKDEKKKKKPAKKSSTPAPPKNGNSGKKEKKQARPENQSGTARYTDVKGSNKEGKFSLSNDLSIGSNIAYPAQVQMKSSVDPTAANATAGTMFFDVLVADHFRDRPMDFSSTLPPVQLKFYFAWAFYTKLRKMKTLTGAYQNGFPEFPDGYYIPKALKAYLDYIGEYKNCNNSFLMTQSVAANPTCTGGTISSGGSGWNQAYLNYTIGYWTQDATTKEMIFVTSDVTTNTMNDAITNGATWSGNIAGSGKGIPFRTVSSFAPDASAYAEVDGAGMAYCPCANFKASLSYVFATMLSSPTGFEFYNQDTVEGGPTVGPNGNSIDVYTSCQNGFVFLINRMPDKVVQEGNVGRRLQYAGNKIKTNYIRPHLIDGTAWNVVMLKTFAQMAQYITIAANKNQQLWEHFTVCTAALLARINQFKICCRDGQFFESTVSRTWKTAKIPAILAMMIDELGPIIYKGILHLPQMFVGATYNTTGGLQHWALNGFTNTNTTNYQIPTNLPLNFSTLSAGGIGPTIGAFTVNTTNFPNNTKWVIMPVTLASELIKQYSNNMAGTNQGESLAVPEYGPLGGRSMVCLNYYVAMTTTAYQAPIVSGSLSINTAVNVNLITSPVIIGGRDLAAALVCGWFGDTATTYAGLQAYQYSVDDPTLHAGFTDYALKHSINAGGEFRDKIQELAARSREMVLQTKTSRIPVDQQRTPPWKEALHGFFEYLSNSLSTVGKAAWHEGKSMLGAAIHEGANLAVSAIPMLTEDQEELSVLHRKFFLNWKEQVDYCN